LEILFQLPVTEEVLMKRIALIAAVLGLIFTAPLAEAQQQAAQDDHVCGFCGMDRQKFAHSAMTIEYEDGTKFAACSLHCAAIDLALNIDKTPKQILVGDYLSKKPVDTGTACWTIGGDQPGVMTKRAKWAFADKTECDKFATEHGAKVADFDESIKAAYEDMYADTKMIREKRKARKSQQEQQGENKPK
jgi:copper chaperone NosL